MFPVLNLPPANLRIEKNEVFDFIRKKMVALTPEEWVRQHVLHFLIHHKNYPPGLIEVEKKINVHNTDKRVDILVRTNNLKPFLLVECKAAEVNITQKEAEQLARYQITIEAPLSLLTNGMKHVVIKHNGNEISYLEELPNY